MKLPNHFPTLPPGCQVVRRDQLIPGDILVNVKGEPFYRVIKVSHENRSTGIEQEFIGMEFVPEQYRHLYETPKYNHVFQRSAAPEVIKNRESWFNPGKGN